MSENSREKSPKRSSTQLTQALPPNDKLLLGFVLFFGGRMGDKSRLVIEEFSVNY